MISNLEWGYTIGALVVFATIDMIAAIARRHKKTTVLEASLWTIVYVSAAIIFGFLKASILVIVADSSPESIETFLVS